MKPDRHAEHKQHAFDSFCKKVIRCEAYNAYRAIGRRQDLEIPFSQLPEEAMETLATWDVYPWEYTSFPVGSDVILIKDDRLAAALTAAVLAGKITHQKRLPLAPFLCGSGMAAILIMEAFQC